jgi:hypothetical protein
MLAAAICLFIVFDPCGWVGESDENKSVNGKGSLGQTSSHPGVTAFLRFDKSTYLLGQNISARFCVRNSSDARFYIWMGGDYRGSPRSLNFKVMAKDQYGYMVADPFPEIQCFGGIGGAHPIEPGETFEYVLPILLYRNFDKPGVYHVVVTHEPLTADYRYRRKLVADATITILDPNGR